MTYRETLLHYKKIIDTGLDEYTRFPPKRQERLLWREESGYVRF